MVSQWFLLCENCRLHFYTPSFHHKITTIITRMAYARTLKLLLLLHTYELVVVVQHSFVIGLACVLLIVINIQHDTAYPGTTCYIQHTAYGREPSTPTNQQDLVWYDIIHLLVYEKPSSVSSKVQQAIWYVLYTNETQRMNVDHINYYYFTLQIFSIFCRAPPSSPPPRTQGGPIFGLKCKYRGDTRDYILI